MKGHNFMKKRMVQQEMLENFITRLKELKKIDDLETIKNQLDKAIEYYYKYVLTKDKYSINDLKRAIFSLSKNKNLSNREEYFKLYREIQNSNLSLDEIIKKFEAI